ncbi:MAG: hydroxymyristoyl-ACP dehydratase [Bacteroidales bacterium]
MNYNILDLIPQRPPMVMIDELVCADERSAKGRFFIRESGVFCEKGFLQEGGMVEFIAQTAAAYEGFQHLTQNEKIGTGFIGAVRNLSVYSLPAVNSEINSEIVVESELLGFTIINGKVIQNDAVLAECELRIYKGVTDAG